MIDILYIRHKEQLSPEDVEIIESLLGKPERDKANRYRQWKDKQAYLLGKLLLATFLQKYDHTVDLLKNLHYTSYNRPYIDSKFDFNISHSGEYVICAFSQDQQVGIDIEGIQIIELNDFSYILNESDKIRIANSTNNYNAFFKIWSAKEAILKANGCGLVDDLHNLEVYDTHGIFEGKIYHLKDLQVNTHYSTIIASSTSIQQVAIAEIPFADCVKAVS